MKLEEIYLTQDNTDMLSAILAVYNKDLPPRLQKTYQELAEELLSDAIYDRYKSICVKP